MSPDNLKFSAHTPPKHLEKWHSLKAHLSKVARRAEELADKFNAGQLAYYAGLWHDLGKYNPDFQKYLEHCHEASKSGEKAPYQKVPHAKYGAKLAAEKFQLIAPLIYGHHGGLSLFPKTLNPQQQGLFALGYYHQRASDRAAAKAASK